MATNVCKVILEKRIIVMDRTFAKKVEDTMSNEYQHLQEVRRDYPDFKVTVKTIKKNPNKETYKGLTYAYMENYILTHESEENALAVIKEFNDMRVISQCHRQGLRYPAIKQWFLDKYPEIEDFGNAA